MAVTVEGREGGMNRRDLFKLSAVAISPAISIAPMPELPVNRRFIHELKVTIGAQCAVLTGYYCPGVRAGDQVVAKFDYLVDGIFAGVPYADEDRIWLPLFNATLRPVSFETVPAVIAFDVHHRLATAGRVQ